MDNKNGTPEEKGNASLPPRRGQIKAKIGEDLKTFITGWAGGKSDKDGGKNLIYFSESGSCSKSFKALRVHCLKITKDFRITVPSGEENDYLAPTIHASTNHVSDSEVEPHLQCWLGVPAFSRTEYEMASLDHFIPVARMEEQHFILSNE